MFSPLRAAFGRDAARLPTSISEMLQRRTMAAAASGRGPAPDEESKEKEWAGDGLIRRVLHVRRTTRMSRAGKVRSLYAMVVIGNGNGGAGFGEGKSTDLAGAVNKAFKRAQRDMIVINRYDNRTIFGTIIHKYVGSEITLRPAPPGGLGRDSNSGEN